MHAVVVEAVPARALGALAIAGEIGLPETLVHEVVLARDVMHVELDLADDLIGIVELVGLGKMGDVAGMNHEGRLGRHRLHLGDGLAQRAECIRVGRLAEADMAVADLQEGEARRFRGQSVAEQA
jgi:hypothetical protein